MGSLDDATDCAVCRCFGRDSANGRGSESHKGEPGGRPAVHIWIEPGKFMMGCADGPHECFDWELSPHLVEIKSGFWIGKTEVTQQAYQRVTGKNPSLYRGPRLPVDQIGWDDAKRYCEQVGMDLPTEVQWEFAARGGRTESRYGPIEEIAWFDANAGNHTHEAAKKQPNAYGLRHDWQHVGMGGGLLQYGEENPQRWFVL